jgi:hypothetical protein
MNRLFTSARASRHLKYGAPFFLFLFGGNYALRQFRSVRYDTDINPKAAQYGKRGVEIQIRSDPHYFAGSCLAVPRIRIVQDLAFLTHSFLNFFANF